METRKVVDLPIGQAGCGSIQLCTDGVVWSIKYEYSLDRELHFGGLLFEDVSAFRFADEQHGKHVPGTYDTVVEVIHSEWLNELAINETPGLLGSVIGKRHFAVLLSSNGYFEFIAGDVRKLDPSECEFGREK
jgi:hypothetical protein